MSRAARSPKTKSELGGMSLAALNTELSHVRTRLSLHSTGRVAKNWQKEIDRIERVREERFGVARSL